MGVSGIARMTFASDRGTLGREMSDHQDPKRADDLHPVPLTAEWSRTMTLMVGLWLALSLALSTGPSSGASARIGRSAVLSPQTVTVRLSPVDRDQVQGRARLTATRGGGTMIVVQVQHLPPGASVTSRLHAGTCSHLTQLSASFARLPTLTANARGRATAQGHVLFHGQRNEPVGLGVLSDGGHVIVLARGPYLVACGVIPRLTR